LCYIHCVCVSIYNTLYAKTHSAPLECDQFVGREHILCETTHSLCGIEHCSVCAAVCTQYAEHAVFNIHACFCSECIHVLCTQARTHEHSETHPHTHSHTHTHRGEPSLRPVLSGASQWHAWGPPRWPRTHTYQQQEWSLGSSEIARLI
jgi:hypothetical protein